MGDKVKLREMSTEKCMAFCKRHERMIFKIIKEISANSRRIRLVACEPTARPVEVKIKAVNEKSGR